MKSVSNALRITLARIALLSIAALLLISCSNNEPAERTSGAAVERISEPWKGDLDETTGSRRFLRALVTYNQTNFFIEKGTPRGAGI